MKYYILLLIGLCLMACDTTRIYEDFNDMEEAYWHMDSVQRFQFQIQDPTKEYNLYASFRNTSAYPFYNIYFQYSLYDSTQTMIKQTLHDYNLFDSKTGEPFGSGLGDMFDHRVRLDERYTFSDAGEYTIELKQYMRLDTLPYILSVGARVELVE